LPSGADLTAMLKLGAAAIARTALLGVRSLGRTVARAAVAARCINLVLQARSAVCGGSQAPFGGSKALHGPAVQRRDDKAA